MAGYLAVATTDLLYRGERRKDAVSVTVHVAPGEYRELTDGGPAFDWGRPTPGALALAHALVREVDHAAPPQVIEAFFHEVVLQLPFIEPWVLWRAEVRDFVAKRWVLATTS